MLAVPMLDRLRIDDVVGAIPVHLFAGIWQQLRSDNNTLVAMIYGAQSGRESTMLGKPICRQLCVLNCWRHDCRKIISMLAGQQNKSIIFGHFRPPLSATHSRQ